MNHRQHRFLYLLITEFQLPRQKLMELWERTSVIQIKPKYHLFLKQKYQDFKKENPEMVKTEIFTMIRTMWKELSMEEKMKYAVVEDKKSRKMSGYNLFLREKFAEIKAKHPDWKLPQISREVSIFWGDLTQEEKNDYKMKSSKEENPNSEDEKYEKIKTVHHDVKDKDKEVVHQVEEVMGDEKPKAESLDGIHSAEVPWEEIGAYFLSFPNMNVNVKGSSIEIKKVDPFLTPEEKEILQGEYEALSVHSTDNLRKMYKANYDEAVPPTFSKEQILEKIYIKERENKIQMDLETRESWIPSHLCDLNPKEREVLEEKKNSYEVERFDFWNVYMHYRSAYPDCERKTDDLTKEWMVEKIIDAEAQKKRIQKRRKLMGIHS